MKSQIIFKTELLYYTLLFLILIFSAIIRLYHLSADAPLDLCWSQGISTDWPWYMESAISKIRSIPYTKEYQFDKTIFTLFTFIIFKIFGIGIPQANFVSVIPGLLTILILSLIIKKSHDKSSSLISAFLLGCNYIFTMYNRTPLIYTTLTFFMVLTVYIWQFGLHSKLFYLITLLLILVTTFHLKQFALILIPILGIATTLRYNFKISLKNIYKPLIILSIILLILIVITKYYDPEFIRHGKMKILAFSPSSFKWQDFITSLLLFDGDSKLFSRMPIVSFLAYLSILFFILDYSKKSYEERSYEFIMIMWFLGGILFFSFLQYHPSRFLIFLIPAMVSMSVFSLKRLWNKGLYLDFAPNKITFTLFFLWLFPLSFRLLYYLSKNSTKLDITSILKSILLTTIIVLLIKMIWKNKRENLILWKSLVIIFLIFSLLYDFFQYSVWAYNPTYTINTYTDQIDKMLGENVKIVGSYAHLLSIKNNFDKVKSLYNIGEDSCDIFEEKKVTHIVTDSIVGERELQLRYPNLTKCLLLVEVFYIRGFRINLYRFLNSAKYYKISLFEEGKLLMKEEKWNESKEIFKKLTQDYPNNSIYWLNYAQSLFNLKEYELAFQNFQRALKTNPDEVIAYLYIGIMYDKIGDKYKAKNYFNNALRLSSNDLTIKEFVARYLN